MYELNKRYTVAAPAGTISPTGVQSVYDVIYAQNLMEDPWKALNPDYEGGRYLPVLPDDWDWVWNVTERKEYTGRFPRRARNYYFKTYKLKCPDKFIEQIGNAAREHSENRTQYSFEFVDRLDWEEGDFGDDGSCFWDDNQGARRMLEDNGAIAVRFYDPDKTDTGIARAWMYPMEAEGIYLLFNGYGFAGNPTLTIARVVSRFLGRRYKGIALTNNGYDEGTLWINGGWGYVIGRQSALSGLDHYDFRWSESGYEDIRYEQALTGTVEAEPIPTPAPEQAAPEPQAQKAVPLTESEETNTEPVPDDPVPINESARGCLRILGAMASRQNDDA
jgi:hypothetical protein